MPRKHLGVLGKVKKVSIVRLAVVYTTGLGTIFSEGHSQSTSLAECSLSLFLHEDKTWDDFPL